jgi:hypothetical protein
MIVRLQQLLVRCSPLRFPAAINFSQIARTKIRPTGGAFCFPKSTLFTKGFSSLSTVRRTPPTPQSSAFGSDVVEKENVEDVQVAPPDLQSPHPSPNDSRNPTDPVVSPTNLLMRTALVGSSVGLLTPVYVAAGVGWIWQTYKPATFVGQAAKFAVGGLLLGAACVNGWTLFTQHLIPFVFNHAEIVLPFAVANAVAASAWYAIGESVFGLQRMSGHSTILNVFHTWIPDRLDSVAQKSGLPLGGPLVGLLTALTCFPMWQPLSQRLWPQELLNACDSSVFADIYLHFLPVGLGTGALVGLGLHFALAPVFTGRIVAVGGLPAASSLLLIILALTLSYFYFCRFDYEAWEQRLNADTGELFWAHSATGEKVTSSSERVLNDTLWFLKGVSLFCNVNSSSNRSHFCFVNKRLLADVLVANAKSSSYTQNALDALDKSKSLLQLYYGVNLKDLNKLIMKLLRTQHDLRMAPSAELTNSIQLSTELQNELIVKIRALGSNADAAAAIDCLLSDLPTLESRLVKEAGQDFSKGTVHMLTAMLSTIGDIAKPSESSGKHSIRKLLAFAARAAIAAVVGGGLFIYIVLKAAFLFKGGF